MSTSNALPFAWQVHHRDPQSTKIPENQLRKHSRGKLERMKKSIDRNGFYLPIICDADGHAVTGVARVLAARELGLLTIPVLIHDQLTPAQIRAIRIADNKLQEGSGWNETALATELADLIGLGFDGIELGFETAELDVLLARLQVGIDEQPDELVRSPETPVTQKGDVWIVGDHRVVCADCRDNAFIDNLMSGRTAAACITDAPYNVPIAGHVSGLGSHHHNEFAMASGEMTDVEFEAFIGAFLSQASRVVRPGGHIFGFMDWRGAHLLTRAALNLQLRHVNTCVWVKTNAGMGSLYRSQHELVLVFRNPGGKSTNNVQLGRYGRSRSNVWHYPGANTFSRTRDDDLAAHPTVKPLALIEDAIKDCTKRGELVLDLFGGSGTTMLAAERCQRKAVLCEIDPGYVDVTLHRFAHTFEIEAVHEATGLSFGDLKAKRAEVTPPSAQRKRMRLSSAPSSSKKEI